MSCWGSLWPYASRPKRMSRFGKIPGSSILVNRGLGVGYLLPTFFHLFGSPAFSRAVLVPPNSWEVTARA